MQADIPSIRRFSEEPTSTKPSDLYVDLLKRCLVDHIFQGGGIRACGGLEEPYDAAVRLGGRDWPIQAHTMIGLARLDNLETCIRTVVEDGVEGDVIETGVWRGGACIFMRALLNLLDQNHRTVWVCDSFQGLPRPEPHVHPEDSGWDFQGEDILKVSIEEVRKNFARYGLLNDSVQFVKGWFKDKLPTLAARKIAVLRLDGDLYSSTWEALTSLFDKLEPGAFVIIDDYYFFPPCRKAVDDFRKTRNLTEPVLEIDGIGAYWRCDD